MDDLEKYLSEGDTDFILQSFNQMAENLEHAHSELSKKNNEILSSINYAKGIQEAILPPKVILNSSLPENFVMYIPKDVVAGDFYWLETVDNITYVAVADCTGHGVPGAMVSVICSISLNKSVIDLGIREPARILDKTRDLVIQTFRRSQKEVKDGMDICFCAIDRKTREVVYSGAENPLYRVTKFNEKVVESDPKIVHDGKWMLLEYKADRQPIGNFISKEPFNQQTIQCEEGDIIYMFSDGFADQFGGPRSRKFMYRPFKKLLLSMREMKMKDQGRALCDEFFHWKGDESQVDDVCVMGIRM